MKSITIKKLISILLTSSLLIGTMTGCSSSKKDKPSDDVTKSTPTSAASEQISLPKTVNYVSLGDSIASGYGLSDEASESYPAQLTSLLEQNGHHVTLTNYGKNGMTSNDLATMIKDGNAPEIENANLITITVGANNILVPSMSFAESYMAYDNESIDGSTLYSKYQSFYTEAKEGVTSLSTDLDEIVATIKTINSDAIIVFTNIYNPYKNIDLSISIAGFELGVRMATDIMVTLVNDKIKEECLSYDIPLADIYTSFEASDEILLNATYDASSKSSNLDPHPNLAGHTQIATTIYQLLE